MWITETAREAGVNTQTLRYYERRGLLPKPPRRGSGYRDYPDDAVRIVRFIKLLRALDEPDEAYGIVRVIAIPVPAARRLRR